MTEWIARPEGYWSEIGSEDGSEDVDPEIPTVRERIVEQLEPEEIHGYSVQAANESAVYVLVASTIEEDVGPVLDVRTVVVDIDDQAVRITDNGLWIPLSRNGAAGLAALASRAFGTTSGMVEQREPVKRSAVDGLEADELLDAPIADEFRREPDPDRDWGYGEGPPPEIGIMIDRLEEAGIGTDERFNRLQFGSKEPWDHDLVGASGLHGNYGVYATESDDLVLVDVDEPDDAPLEELPETFRVSSASGPDEQGHLYYRIDDLERLREEIGTLNVGPSWGEVRSSNQYVVGPGCELQTGGSYDIVDDRPIEEISAERLVELLLEDPDVTPASDDSGDERERSLDLEDEQGDDEPDADLEDVPTVECFECGASIPEPGASLIASDGDRRIYRCSGGCSR